MELASKKIMFAVLLGAGLGGAVATAAPITVYGMESFTGARTQKEGAALPGGHFWWIHDVTPTSNGESTSIFWEYNNGNAGYCHEYAVRFALSDLGYGAASITSVNLKVTEIAKYYVGHGVGVFYSTSTASASDYPAGDYGPVHPAYYLQTGTTFHLVNGGVITDQNAPYSLSLDVTSVVKQAYADGLDYVWFTLYSESQATTAGQNTWQSTWGTPYNSNAAYRPQLEIVPEPAALSLLALGALAGLGRRRR
ncbi:MAG: PEP-CTERM sorting domain-containing protein [Lentisphaeria bacterium]